MKIKLNFECPKAKTFMLLQAHMFNLPVPIRDYITDMKIIVESTVRILSALIDLASEKRYLRVTL